MFLLPRTRLARDYPGLTVDGVVLEACRQFGGRTALVDYSTKPPRRLTYAQYGDLVERAGKSFAARFHPGEVIAIFLYNSWEFCVAYHAATLSGCIPTLLNPTYREREVRYQLEDAGAVALITDGSLIEGINLSGLPKLREIFCIRSSSSGTAAFSGLFETNSGQIPKPTSDPVETLAALPYSSGTTGLPKGVMLSHANLVSNVFQFLAPGEEATYTAQDSALCPLPLYHIYGLNVVLNPVLAVGAKLVLIPRYDESTLLRLLVEEAVTFMPLVPPLVNCLCQAAEQGRFPRDHSVRYVKSGAAPLAPELPRRLAELTGIRLRQGYGMTEAAPVTHMGFLEPELYRPDSIGPALALTDCRLEGGGDPQSGELVMRGPQFMLGYWNAPEATASALRDGWYWSGDIATVDDKGFFTIVDRVKEMIKYKGFSIAPAEVEAVLLEHPLVRDCGLVGRQDTVAGEVPCAFVVLRDAGQQNAKVANELCGYVADRLTHYKQPRDVRFVSSIPRNPSGKILRRRLREELA
ncbi:MAG TPA: AMP-binding protein [Terriglobales bacterium]|nr:AMP-binding protein [Terriglobales bacterium]